ncbi:MAG: SUMF1/EgtB/PvdO family nonheme iron enzyme [Proteobacteria bacterium]|nr:SUMF1/EgtB/PvdO family nonheme iron enzyme [Pseudomonadota bacterium]
MNGRRIIVTLLSVMIATAVTGNLQAFAVEKKAKERLAVLDLEAKHGVEKSLAEALSVIVRDKLHGFGEYEVMSKGDIQAVASREQLKQALGCDEDGSQCLVDFGRAIGTRFMVAGDISKLGATYIVSLRMLDTKGEGASVKNRVSESCKCDEDALIGTVQDVAAKLLGKPTANAAKKIENEAKKLAEEKSNEVAVEQKRLVEERRKTNEEKHRLAGEVEKLRKKKEQATLVAAQKRVTAESKPALDSSLVKSSAATGKTHTDSTTGMEFVLVPGGCFQMGDTFGDGSDEEKPVHEVCVDGFYMGKYEVTQGQYQVVTGNNPSNFKQGNNYPVEKVNWNDAQSFIRLLNGKGSGKYRLPTEAEWEFAAREGGKRVRFGTGKDTIGPDEANFDGSVRYKKTYSRTGNYRAKTVAVGSFQPNSLGLYDMSGNVWEWCGDWFDSGYYGKSPRNNPEGAPSGSYRVNRGGSCSSNPWYVRTAYRLKYLPDYANNFLGFRLVLPVHQSDPPFGR